MRVVKTRIEVECFVDTIALLRNSSRAAATSFSVGGSGFVAIFFGAFFCTFLQEMFDFLADACRMVQSKRFPVAFLGFFENCLLPFFLIFLTTPLPVLRIVSRLFSGVSIAG